MASLMLGLGGKGESLIGATWASLYFRSEMPRAGFLAKFSKTLNGKAEIEEKMQKSRDGTYTILLALSSENLLLIPG